MKGIRVNGKHSFEDFGLVIGERNIGVPSPKRITESVPYQNGSYDFSDLNGEVTYEDNTIKYSFSIAEITTESMDLEKRGVLAWLNSAVNTKIYDDYDPGYYFYGSLKSISWKEDFGPGTLEVIFLVYPYKLENKKTSFTYHVNGELEIDLKTNCAHQVIPTIITDAEMLIERNNTSIAIGIGTYQDLEFVLFKENLFRFVGNGTITFEFVKEVF